MQICSDPREVQSACIEGSGTRMLSTHLTPDISRLHLKGPGRRLSGKLCGSGSPCGATRHTWAVITGSLRSSLTPSDTRAQCTVVGSVQQRICITNGMGNLYASPKIADYRKRLKTFPNSSELIKTGYTTVLTPPIYYYYHFYYFIIIILSTATVTATTYIYQAGLNNCITIVNALLLLFIYNRQVRLSVCPTLFIPYGRS
jgi:hypothetical protein